MFAKSLLVIPTLLMLSSLTHAFYHITVHNQCQEPIWGAALQKRFQVDTNPDFPVLPVEQTGWYFLPGQTHTITVPDHWTTGRIWARQHCAADGSHCDRGGQGGASQFYPTDFSYDDITLVEIGWGVSNSKANPPSRATFYNLSNVMGFNMAMSIVPQTLGKGCDKLVLLEDDHFGNQSCWNPADGSTPCVRACPVGTNFDVYFCPSS